MDGQSFGPSPPHIGPISLVEDPNPKPVKLVVNQHNRNGEVQTSNILSTLPSQSLSPGFPPMGPFPIKQHNERYQPVTKANLKKLESSHALGLKASHCELCIRGFIGLSQLCKHFSRRPKLNPNCQVCIAGFKSPEQLEQHLNKHMLLVCYICNEAKCSKAILKAHIKSHKRRGQTTRNLFLKQQNNQRSERKPKVTVETPHKVKNCLNICTSAFGPKGYRYIKNRNYNKISHIFTLLKKTADAPLTCVLCQKEFPRADYLVEHMMAHVGYKPFRCSLCPEGYTRPGRIVDHFVRVHCQHEKGIPELYFDDNEKCIFPRLYTGSKVAPKALSAREKESTKKESTNVLMNFLQSTKKKPSSLNSVSSGNNAEESIYDSEENLSADEGDREERSHIRTSYITVSPSTSVLEETQSTSGICKSAVGAKGYKYIKNKNYNNISSVFSLVKKTADAPLTCTVCQREFPRSDYLVEHMMSHFGYRPFRCSLCPDGTFRPGKIVEHFVRIHCQHEKAIPELYFDHNQKCVFVRLWTGSKDATATLHSTRKDSGSVLIELPQTSKKRPSPMSVVGSGNDTGESSEDNSEEEALNADQGDVEEKSHVCKICTINFPIAPMLEEHVRTVHSPGVPLNKLPSGPNPYRYVKSKNYHNIASMFSQVKSKHGSTLTCSVCQRKFSRSENLVHHMMTHSGYRPFKCSLCSAGFFRPGKIVEHFLRAHHQYDKRIPELYFDDNEKCIFPRFLTGPTDMTDTLPPMTIQSSNVLIPLPQTTDEIPLPMDVIGGDDNQDEIYVYDSEENSAADEGEWEEKPHVCLICSSIFPSASMLEEHMTKPHVAKLISKPAASGSIDLMSTNSLDHSEPETTHSETETSIPSTDVIII